MLVLSPNTSSMKKALCTYNVLGKTRNKTFNQTYNTFPTSRKKILKLFSLGPRYHREKWKYKKKPISLCLEENHTVKGKRNEGSFMELWHTGYASVSLRREESCRSSQNEGAGEGGVRESTWITVCTLDVSKSEANSL